MDNTLQNPANVVRDLKSIHCSIQLQSHLSPTGMAHIDSRDCLTHDAIPTIADLKNLRATTPFASQERHGWLCE